MLLKLYVENVPVTAMLDSTLCEKGGTYLTRMKEKKEGAKLGDVWYKGGSLHA